MSGGRIMIVEDEVTVAEDLRRGLAAAGYDVVGHAVDGRQAITDALASEPDLVLMDVSLGGDLDGVAVARAIASSMDVAIVYVSATTADALVDLALRAGADGYVVKPFQLPQVTTTIRVALHQRKTRLRGPVNAPRPDHFTGILQQLQAVLVDENAWGGLDEGARAMRAITPREKEIIRGLLACRRLSMVADVLGISPHTARNHLKSIFRKLDVHSQDELLRFLIDGPAT